MLLSVHDSDIGSYPISLIQKRMNFGLALRILGSSAFLPITEAEYEEIALAKAGLLEALFLEEKFDLVVENYLELETCFLDSTARQMVLRGQDYKWFQVERNLFNRRLVNLLSVVRAYIDHTQHHIRIVLPNDGNAAARVKEAFSGHYDKCFGYRVMEALRNYVQHRGFPIHAIEYPAKWLGEDDEARLMFGLSLFTKTKYLRGDEKFKESVLKELEDLGGRVNLKPLIRQYVAAMGDVHDLVRELIRIKIEKWDCEIITAITRFKSAFPNESSVKGLAAVIKEEKGYRDPVEIFSDIIEYRNELQRKNSALTNLGRRYVTGELL